MNKITILNISGKKKDRNLFKFYLKHIYRVFDYSNKNLSNCSARQILRKIEGAANNLIPYNGLSYFPEIVIFENINFEVIQIIGDEINNMVLDIHFNKVNKCINKEQFHSYFELLGKL